MDESDTEEEAKGVIRVKDFGRRLANQASVLISLKSFTPCVFFRQI